jgi:acetyl-CoA acyltransferase
MNKVFIVKTNRTPFGKIGGLLAPVRPDDLLAKCLKDLTESLTFDLEKIDDIYIGCANQAGEDNRNIARMSSTLAGIPFSVPATTINRLCASSLDAVGSAYARIKSGLADCVIAGGVESMSRAPYVLSKTGTPFGRDQKIWDSSFGWRFPNKKMEEIFPLLGMGQTAENLVEKYNISREDQDNFALSSHLKSSKNKGFIKKTLLPVEVKLRKKSYIVDFDECVRENSTIDSLLKLKPVFKNDGSVTAGNSSPMNDGAGTTLIVSESFLKKHNFDFAIEITGYATAGVHPDTMGIGPVESTKKAFHQTSTSVDNYDLFEMNEAFAVQVLACQRELDIPLEKVNPIGGAISMGHPLGASGVRLIHQIFHQMKSSTDIKSALATMCVGLGQGVTISIKSN